MYGLTSSPARGQRPSRSVQLNVTLPKEADDLLEQYAATRKGKGAFIARLVYEHVARVEARAERQAEESPQ